MTRKINITQKTTAALLCTSLLALAACGTPFTSTSGEGLNKSGGNTTVAPTTPAPNTWENFKMEGSVDQKSQLFAGEKAVDIDKATKELVLRLPMLANPYLDGLSIAGPLPDLPGASIGLEAMPDGGSALVLRLPLHYVTKGVDFLEPARLPNGDPLPKMPASELPALAIQLSNLGKDIKAAIYVGTSAVGIFVNTPFNPYLTISAPIRNKDGTKTYGYVSTVPVKGTNDGGFFLSFVLPNDIARFIDDHL